MYIEKVLDFPFQLLKNGSENKSAAFIFLFSVLWLVPIVVRKVLVLFICKWLLTPTYRVTLTEIYVV